jgi:hypothetical protein
MTKINIQLGSDKEIEKVITEKIVHPLKNNLNINPIVINRAIEKQFTEQVKQNISIAIHNLFQDERFKNTFYYNVKGDIESAIRHELNNEIQSTKEKLNSIGDIRKDIDEFKNQITNCLNSHVDAMSLYQSEILEKITSSCLSPLTNLYYISETIEVDKKIDAEQFVKEKFECDEYEVRRDCKFEGGEHIKKIGIPDFVICPKLYEDKNKKENIRAFYNRPGWMKYWDSTVAKQHVIYSNKPFFVEVKTNGDGLRREQMEWIKTHPQFKVIVFYLKQNIKHA